MLKLSHTLKAWHSPASDSAFKKEIAELAHTQLPLQQCLSHSSQVSDEPIQAIILHRSEDSTALHIKAGIFYTGIIVGCSCADDPTPVDTIQEYCELLFRIDRQSAETRISIAE